MPMSFVFWFLMLLILLFGWGPYWPITNGWRSPFLGWTLLLIAVALMGWRVFGFPIQ